MPPAPFPTTAHPRVWLRPLTEADIAPWFAYLSLPAVFEHTSWNLQSPQDLWPCLPAPGAAWADAAAQLRWAIAERSNNQLVGTAGFHTVSPVNRTAEIAYDLAPEVWGQGIATAVCRDLTTWAHGHFAGPHGLLRVQATVLETNVRSAAVLARCGFAREGLLKSYRLVRGVPGNFWMYAHVRAPEVGAAAGRR